ncbi:MAG: hypothetical protein CVT92_08760 [Bacteroidetes bacterium HGW-Bacteroidetes-1]|jgi:hypothetical protein|nr:MAG: hypothetical protein CVT92_08760 [Bacteroidetes bacterium HGW-Bacteroidetes-1]
MLEHFLSVILANEAFMASVPETLSRVRFDRLEFMVIPPMISVPEMSPKLEVICILLFVWSSSILANSLMIVTGAVVFLRRFRQSSY